MKSILTILVFSIVTPLSIIAQNKSFQIGGKIINELTFHNGFAPGFGGQIIYKMGTHGGIESGLFYQSKPIGFNFIVSSVTGSNYYFAKISERRILFPIFYRFNSKVINFSAGPIMDYFINWKTRSASQGVSVNNYDRNALQIIASAGVSKTIWLSGKWLIEPEVLFNFNITEEDGGVALNFCFRKKLF